MRQRSRIILDPKENYMFWSKN